MAPIRASSGHPRSFSGARPHCPSAAAWRRVPSSPSAPTSRSPLRRRCGNRAPSAGNRCGTGSVTSLLARKRNGGEGNRKPPDQAMGPNGWMFLGAKRSRARTPSVPPAIGDRRYVVEAEAGHKGGLFAGEQATKHTELCQMDEGVHALCPTWSLYSCWIRFRPPVLVFASSSGYELREDVCNTV